MGQVEIAGEIWTMHQQANAEYRHAEAAAALYGQPFDPGSPASAVSPMISPGSIEIIPRVRSGWMAKGTAVVIKDSDTRYLVVSDRTLSKDELLYVMAGYFLKQQDAEELRNLREDCEAGMNLDNARKVLNELAEIEWWSKLRAALRIGEEE